MLTKEKGRFFLVVLALVLLFANFSNTLASNSSDEIDVKEKTALYKLDNIADLLKSGANDVTFHWKDLDGISQSVDLVITVNEDGILSVKEKNISSVEELNAIKTSIEQKDSGINLQARTYPEVPYKLNGGMTRSQFVNDHAFNRHKYEFDAYSSCSRTRYARDVGVGSLRNSTVAQYDEKYAISYPASHAYIKRYRDRVSMLLTEEHTYTNYHRVINNYSDPGSSTHHPLCN